MNMELRGKANIRLKLNKYASIIEAEMFDEAWVSFDQLLDEIPAEETDRIKSSPIAQMFDQLESEIRKRINPDSIPPEQ